jgi:hypothetical protein
MSNALSVESAGGYAEAGPTFFVARRRPVLRWKVIAAGSAFAVATVLVMAAAVPASWVAATFSW